MNDLTATATRPVPPPPTGNGRRPAGQTVGVGTRRRMSWVVLGILLTAGAALAFVTVLTASGARTPVLVAARDLQPGRPVDINDFRTVNVAVDGTMATIPAEQAGQLVGRTPIAPIPGGALVHPAAFGTGSGVQEGETIVGTSFKVGELPTSAIRAGDHVALIEVASNNPNGDGGASVLGVGDVHGVDTVKDTGEVAVSVRVPLSQGAAVANAAAQKRLRLVLVAPDALPEQLQVTVRNHDGSSTAGTAPSRPRTTGAGD